MEHRLGPLTIEQKKRNVVKRAKLEKNKEDLKRPQELKEEDISRSPNETTKNVAIVSILCSQHKYILTSPLQLQKLLNDNPDPINLFKFIINPNDFAQSVENIFYLSFLIRDGHVAFEIQDGEPIICSYCAYHHFSWTHVLLDPCEPPTDEDRMGGGLRKRQLVTQFDMATWRVGLSPPVDDTSIFPTNHIHSVPSKYSILPRRRYPNDRQRRRGWATNGTVE